MELLNFQDAPGFQSHPGLELPTYHHQPYQPHQLDHSHHYNRYAGVSPRQEDMPRSQRARTQMEIRSIIDTDASTRLPSFAELLASTGQAESDGRRQAFSEWAASVAASRSPASPLQPPAGYGGGFLTPPDEYYRSSPLPERPRRRSNLPREATNTLKEWFRAHADHPYPSEDQKKDLLEKTKLSLIQLQNWFINARRRGPGREAREIVARVVERERVGPAAAAEAHDWLHEGRASSEDF